MKLKMKDQNYLISESDYKAYKQHCMNVLVNKIKEKL